MLKLDYIKLLNQFWKLRRSKRITSIQADVYLFLIQECNGQDWENPFECSNRSILLGIGISESALTDARNRLKQLGLIDFEGGKRNEKSPVYHLFYPVKKGKEEGKPEGKEEGKPEGKDPNIYNKPNQTETKQKQDSDSNESVPPEKKELEGDKPHKEERKKPSAQKKKEEATPFWQMHIQIWVDFNLENYGLEPTLEGPQFKQLKNILHNLQRRAEKKGHGWGEEHAKASFTLFLQYAYKTKWLRDHFLLSNLEKQLDTIISNGINKTGEQQQGIADHQRELADRIAKITGQG